MKGALAIVQEEGQVQENERDQKEEKEKAGQEAVYAERKSEEAKSEQGRKSTWKGKADLARSQKAGGKFANLGKTKPKTW